MKDKMVGDINQHISGLNKLKEHTFGIFLGNLSGKIKNLYLIAFKF